MPGDSRRAVRADEAGGASGFVPAQGVVGLADPVRLPGTPEEAFDALYAANARSFTRQAFLLSGHRRVAERAVTWGFHRAWEHWPQVAVDSDPAGWVRAEVYAYALSPWHQLRPGRREPEAYAGPPEDRELLDALLSLPRCYRAALLLYDGLGLSLPDTAAEAEASTRATAARVTHAREALAERWPELRETPEEARHPLLAARLRELAAAQPVRTAPAEVARRGSEDTTRKWTRASIGLTVAVAAATAFTLLTVDSRYVPDEPESGPSVPASTAPPGTGGRVAPGPDGSGRPDDDKRSVLPQGGPAAPVLPGRTDRGGFGSARGHVLPGPADTTPHAYLPQLRSTNERMRLKNFADGPREVVQEQDVQERDVRERDVREREGQERD